ncbi:hypothetical protein AB0L05_21100 [Nonomuraea pusilla]|uniref:hypothetical protein n=1 Tax=Nonomuraea pusilla TaxID=46177 RepID=UPI003329835E
MATARCRGQSHLTVPVVFGDLLGFSMLVHWIPVHRAGGTSTAPQRSIPVAVVAGHGVLAVVTLIPVLITNVAGSWAPASP